MATCQEVITRAHRMCNWRAIGSDPTTAESNFALPALQSIFDGWVMNGMFGRLTDKLVTEDYTALEGQRVVVSGSATVTIPTTYSFCGEEGSDRPPYDLSLIEVQDGATRNVWLYDRNEWVDIAELTIDGDCPLSGRNLHGLAAVLATEIDGPQGFIPDTVRASAQQFLRQLAWKNGSQRPPRTAEYF
jgi:hypothetical protein